MYQQNHPHGSHTQQARSNYYGMYTPQGPSNFETNWSASQSTPSASMPPQTYRQAAINPQPSGFEALQAAMEIHDSPPPSPPPQAATATDQSSALSKAVDFCIGLVPLKTALHRKFSEVYDALGQRMQELGIRWTEPSGRGHLNCEYGHPGTNDYVAFSIHFVVNGGSKPMLPGAVMWYTKVSISKNAGNGRKFRKIAGSVLDAAKYDVRGGVQYDYTVGVMDA